MAVANRKIKFSGKTFVTPTSGGGGGGSSLTVEEQDGVPSVSPVNTIRVSNGTLTDEGGGVVSIVTGGGTVPGVAYGEVVDDGGTSISLSTTYVGFNTGAVGEISNMTFTAGTGSDPDVLAPDEDGTYQLVASFSVSSQEANRTITAAGVPELALPLVIEVRLKEMLSTSIVLGVVLVLISIPTSSPAVRSNNLVIEKEPEEPVDWKLRSTSVSVSTVPLTEKAATTSRLAEPEETEKEATAWKVPSSSGDKVSGSDPAPEAKVMLLSCPTPPVFHPV